MSTKISKGSIIASFIYEKSTNLKGYEEMDLLTISEVKKNDGYLGHELFNSNPIIIDKIFRDIDPIINIVR